MITDKIGKAGKFILTKIVKFLAKCHINPNFLTLTGLLISIIAAFYFSRGEFITTGILIILGGFMDMLDGSLARETNTVSKFGGFFDSVIDRYSDIILYLGLIVYFGKIPRFHYVVLVGVCIMGSVMTSYTRARAESIIKSCKVGFLERPERVVLLIIGCLFNRIEAVLWVIAVLSNWTVIVRIVYTYLELPKVHIIKPTID